MTKRKREAGVESAHLNGKKATVSDEFTVNDGQRAESGTNVSTESPITVQIVAGTYEKILHGITATMPLHVNETTEPAEVVEFADTFLFNAHGSAIRCLAISPTSSNADSSKTQKAILASGSSDQIINLYHISTSPPALRKSKGPSIPTVAGNGVTENPKNRELGSLQHHSSSINAMQFPTRSKLLSAAEDNTIAVTRTRDWTVLSTIKAPIPKAHGRPSGDTAPLGGIPAGINDFAIHPSMKLMVSVGKGEKCMRLWNLVTGKKAGVLNFERELLQDIGEGRWASGEGRKVEWNSLGEEFVVGFERGALVFGMDSKPKCRVLPSPPSKIHQLHYLAVPGESDTKSDMLAVSTEDGRVVFYSTLVTGRVQESEPGSKPAIPSCRAIGQLGGALEGSTGRIKDFEILLLPEQGSGRRLIIVSGSSNGAIRLWMLEFTQLTRRLMNLTDKSSHGSDTQADSSGHGNSDVESSLQVLSTLQVGRLLGVYQTGNRITCIKAFVMSNRIDSTGTMVENKDTGHMHQDHQTGGGDS